MQKRPCTVRLMLRQKASKMTGVHARALCARPTNITRQCLPTLTSTCHWGLQSKAAGASLSDHPPITQAWVCPTRESQKGACGPMSRSARCSWSFHIHMGQGFPCRLCYSLANQWAQPHSQVNPEPHLEVLQGNPVCVLHQVTRIVHIPACRHMEANA